MSGVVSGQPKSNSGVRMVGYRVVYTLPSRIFENERQFEIRIKARRCPESFRTN
jgi:hypothetical protein